LAAPAGIARAERVTSRAVDVFGGHGLVRDCGAPSPGAKVAAFLDGAQQIQQLVIARDRLTRGAWRAPPPLV
jgi:alkylation response protein AidB-like acyl-CoA dehydrogenase